MARPIPKSAFANPDARVRCITPDCWGDLVLFPTGQVDEEGIPEFANATLCPLCSQRFELDPDINDRDLYLKVSWLRANPMAPGPPESLELPEQRSEEGDEGTGA